MARTVLNNGVTGLDFRTLLNNMFAELYTEMAGKALTTHNHDSAYYGKAAVDTLLEGFVPLVEGMGLSENDYSDTEKAKVGSAYSYAQTSRVATADIVDDLTTGGSTKVLSAEQGKGLKTIVDGKVPTLVDPTGATAASAEHEGKLRYSIQGGSSLLEVCMKSGESTYVWTTLATQVIS